MRILYFAFTTLLLLQFTHCSSPDNPAFLRAVNAAAKAANKVDWWVTTADQKSLLKKQRPLIFDTIENKFPTIGIDTEKVYQSIDGFGYTLTGGSASLIWKLEPSARHALLNELFGHNENSIGVSYLRLPIGASDLSGEVYSYDDMPPGENDPELKNFSLLPERAALLPLLREIKNVNPKIKFMGSPWSAPVWMKDNQGSVGGSLKPEYMQAYAHYFVKYIQKMSTEGFSIDAITIQNEPQHGGNNPSMLMSAEQQADFIINWLGPAFRSAGIDTKIIIYDHNCDHPEYPLTILNDRKAKAFIDGTAFHLYAGDISVLSSINKEHPDRNIYFTEQYTANNSSFAGDLGWHLKNVIIGSTRNWSKTALEWNLANDASWGPHTPGGCTTCRGALTIDGSNIAKNVSYYIIGHASKFVLPGSLRLGSNVTDSIQNVAFRRPDGRKVLIAYNESSSSTAFNIKCREMWVTATLAAGSVASFVW